MSRQSLHQSSEPPPSHAASLFASTRLHEPLTRLSSPLAGPSSGPRFRSISRDPSKREDKFQRAREASQRRLYDAWDAISAKYADIRPEEDDEVDIFTGRITVDRGRLRALETREFADGLSDGSDLEEEDDDPLPQGPESAYFGPDEDELGDWDDRSGLDTQEPPEEVEEEWTVEDEMDLRAFHAAEARLRGSEGYPDSAAVTRSVLKGKGKVPSLEDLFIDSESESNAEDRRGGETTLAIVADPHFLV
ncbi:uncharacterized protein LOC62_06G008443 [Vanrija pseudolonga]|uniref:Uncharacterized protein n=1 Tax=Vanrija pseudolonga TaxID=143232 RepID=A0AAF0YH22_9TREE|nr:hypothetical protein LOC62_06G008443 [Vanrija pseudolonga]